VVDVMLKLFLIVSLTCIYFVANMRETEEICHISWSLLHLTPPDGAHSLHKSHCICPVTLGVYLDSQMLVQSSSVERSMLQNS